MKMTEVTLAKLCIVCNCVYTKHKVYICIFPCFGRLHAVNCRVHHPTLGHWSAGIKESQEREREREREVDRKHVNEQVDRHI